MTTENFDLLVVGGGKAGKSLAMDLAAAGQSVAMVERGMIGGTCINVACIPTKTLVNSARLLALTRRAAEFGIDATASPPSASTCCAPARRMWWAPWLPASANPSWRPAWIW
ncbi:FAD-dependent oxidoreductase [Arthrobacter alpinus]|nr:FAD-dependent oxidoreductase [Arthrobacter alpinus]